MPDLKTKIETRENGVAGDSATATLIVESEEEQVDSVALPETVETSSAAPTDARARQQRQRSKSATEAEAVVISSSEESAANDDAADNDVEIIRKGNRHTVILYCCVGSHHVTCEYNY